MEKFTTVCLAIGIALAITSIAGADATSSSRAVLHWDTFWCDYTSYDDESPGFIDLWWHDSISTAEAENSVPDSDEMWSSGWEDTYARAEVQNAWGEAWTSDWPAAMEVGEEVYADTTGQGLFWAESSAYAERWGDFMVEGDGQLTVSIDYSLVQDLTTGVFGDVADGRSTVTLGLDTGGWGDTMEDSIWLGPVVNGADFSDDISGTLWLFMDLSDGDEGSLWMSADNWARVESVPVPGAVLLGILGLGVAGFKLRKFA